MYRLPPESMSHKLCPRCTCSIRVLCDNITQPSGLVRRVIVLRSTKRFLGANASSPESLFFRTPQQATRAPGILRASDGRFLQVKLSEQEQNKTHFKHNRTPIVSSSPSGAACVSTAEEGRATRAKRPECQDTSDTFDSGGHSREIEWWFVSAD